MEKIGIIGAGTMGSGIAQVVALANYKVTIFDADQQKMEQAIHYIEQSLDKLITQKKIVVDQKTTALNNLSITSDSKVLSCSDLIIEAIVEKLEVKKTLFLELEKIVSDQTILASNTSSISITKIAKGLICPMRVAGLHFFNPAPLMKLVEVVKGIETSESVIQQLKNFTRSLHKTPIVAKDAPGFIVNRVARHYYVESLRILEENGATIENIDKLAEASGFKMGPFKLMDLIGNDINYAVTESLFQAFNYESKFRPSRIQQQKVDAGHLGRKTGKGFYDYQS